MQYLKKYYKYRLKQSAGSQFQTPDDKLLSIIATCAQNKFSEVTPFVNINKLFRKDVQLWSSVCKLPLAKDEPYNEEFLYGNDPDRRDFRKTLLMAAVIGGNLNRINFVLPYSNIEAITDFGHSALSLACNMNRLDIVILLLDRGATTRTLAIDCILGRTIQNNNIDLFTLLINRGADANSYCGYISGETVLMSASRAGHLNMVRLLVDNGARLEESFWRITLTRQSILQYVQSKCVEFPGRQTYDEIHNTLIRYNASLINTDDIGCTALMMAIEYEKPDVVEFLCSRGAIINGEMKLSRG